MDKRHKKKRVQKEYNSTRKQRISEHPKANREHKDCLFRKVFERKEDLLQLYNAINGTDYRNTEELEVNTLEDVVYLGIKNDKSFLVGGTMNLYEHQSTKNPNIPIRGFLYFARLYQQYIETRNIRLYGSTLIKLPFPQYIVFYNGTKEEPSKSQLRLSEAFEIQESESALECVATMFNINYGYNQELLEKCRRLEEYSIFVARVRRQVEMCKDLNTAIDMAVDECIEGNILKDLLLKSRAEVRSMILTSFNQEEYEQTIRDESYNEGKRDGEEQLLTTQVKKKVEKGYTLEEIADFLEVDIEQIRELLEKSEK